MPLTLTQIRTEVRDNILRDVNGFSNDRIDRHINWAQQRIADRHTFEEMRKYTTGATVDGQKRYSFPARMKDIYDITVQDGDSSRKLDYVNSRYFDMIKPRPEADTEDRPHIYVDYGVEYELYPIPGQVYTLNIRYSEYPVALTVAGEESALLNKDHVIVACATAMCFYSLVEMEMGAYWDKTVFKTYFDESVTSDHSAEDWTPVARGYVPDGESSYAWLSNDWRSPFYNRR